MMVRKGDEPNDEGFEKILIPVIAALTQYLSMPVTVYTVRACSHSGFFFVWHYWSDIPAVTGKPVWLTHKVLTM